MNIDKLQQIKENIEKMNKCYQLEILKILNNDATVILSENNNGTFINLSNLEDDIISKLEEYIKYVDKQQNQLLNIEQEKANIKSEFFTQDKAVFKYKRRDNKKEVSSQSN
jgi:hypothetical protein